MLHQLFAELVGLRCIVVRQLHIAICQLRTCLRNEIADIRKRDLFFVREVPVDTLQTRFASIDELRCGLLAVEFIDG